MRNLALFDFDGTITSKDTLLEFIKYYHGNRRFYIGILYLSPVLSAMKLKLITNHKAKELMLIHFFKNESEEKFNGVATEFSRKMLPSLIKPKALKKIKDHLEKKDTVFIVSASAVNWIEGWSQPYDIKLLATELETSGGKITGKIKGANCNGPEKVVRIKKELDISSFDQVYAYGDTSGDMDMLALADHAFYRLF